MNSKRMEAQARSGDILVAIGGTEGVLFLANLYHDAGKPVVPLNLKLLPHSTGARRLFDFGLTSSQTHAAVPGTEQTALDPHGWINRLNSGAHATAESASRRSIELLEVARKPTAFGVRLLNPANPEYRGRAGLLRRRGEARGRRRIRLQAGGRRWKATLRIQPRSIRRYSRSCIAAASSSPTSPANGRTASWSSGYALGRGLPTLLLGKAGVKHPFDLVSLGGHHWRLRARPTTGAANFVTHWEAIRNRPPLVNASH